jgi:hypothetical protein
MTLAKHSMAATTRWSRRTRRPQTARLLAVETLDPRRLLTGGFDLSNASAEWQNPFNPLDADGDGLAQPIDVLMHVNWLNVYGAGPLPSRVNVDGAGGVAPFQPIYAAIWS